MSKVPFGTIEPIEDIERSRSDLDTNCVQIFSKSTAFTREFLEKIEDGAIGPKATKLFGRNIRTRQLWVLSSLCMLFFSSCLSSLLMTYSDLFETFIFSHLLLTNKTKAFETWQQPAVNNLIRVHIFNYTNLKEFEDRKVKKLHVEDIGPFVYEERLERVNIKFYQNGSMSYQDHRTHAFRADLSQGRKQSDRVIVPNMPFMGAAAMTKHAYFMTRYAMSALLKTLNTGPFLELPAEKFIWGYDDNFFNLARGVMAYKKQLPFERFGILATRNGTSKDTVTINTGLHDVSRLGFIDKYNGEDHLNFWSTDECNKIKGSDGTTFSPIPVRQKQNVHVYYKDLCRSLPFRYHSNVTILNQKIAAFKYTLADSVYDTAEREPENQCYCDLDSGNCAPQGVFNATPCAYGSPMFISFPHFYKADPAIQNAVTGLHPKANLSENYLYLHPTMGFPMAGKNSLQINVQIKKSEGLSQMDLFNTDDIILPVAWIEMGVDEKDLPESIREQIYEASITVPMLEALLLYGSLLTTAITFTAICLLVRAIVLETRVDAIVT